MRIGALASASLLLPILPPAWVSAATLRVPGSHATIQAEIDAAAAGDTVLVGPGTYSGEGNRDLTFRGKDLVLRSEAGRGVTIIQVNGFPETHRGFFFQDGETPAAVVEGFTVVGG